MPLRYLTSGESHGEMLLGILEGMPSGLELIAERDIDPLLQERQQGYGRGRRQAIEDDRVQIVSGVRFGKTTGAPIGLLLRNKDWTHWKEKMSVVPVASEPTPVSVPRPGHADFAGAIKYGHDDIRNVLERSSARGTAIRTAIGAVCIKLLGELGIIASSWVSAIGGAEARAVTHDSELSSRISASPVKTHDPEAEARMIAAIDRAIAARDTVGGVVECHIAGMPVGAGSHVHWDRKLDGLLAQSIMSIQAVKAVEIGSGMSDAAKPGSAVHGGITSSASGYERLSNNAGGIEGGMSNGEPIVVRAYMKPISTLMRPLPSVDMSTGAAADAHIERSDVCAVPALSIIVRAVTAITIASAMLDTFGGDTLAELQVRIDHRRSSAIPRSMRRDQE